ncbi:hypothetical protein NDA14_002038 [Ustilago hordei]|uniref:Reverse transcriptase RNase H-like domain-containing protein n=1 Tax=Ustilago hordei TaxID=120017 RepID=I2FLY4_USTHO|nr:uncharacterized protein UHO2_05377 [Ustilago hordei]KAJ1599441.1 hypothetical protein NDA14_002038 [Ustilago hordei]CCF47927.1 uncharacterized protein UHOR_06639 [Ustilago hordei]SYW86753.1 uncharacterized protein UHO2_05377 [Ustilago hordei]
MQGCITRRSVPSTPISAISANAADTRSGRPPTPITLLTDNQAAEHIISTNGPGRNKLLTLRAAFMRDTIKKGIVAVKWITGELQVANGLTKLLDARGSSKSREDFGVKGSLVAHR